MAFIVVAIVGGLVIGFARGGRLSRLADVSLRLWPLLAAGLLLQASAALTTGTIGFVLILVSYAALMVFAAANVTIVGMPLVVIGVAMNFAVIAVNGGMPVRAEAIVAADVADWDQLDELDFGNKRHLEKPDDQLTFLADIIPVPVAREVLSFGDLVLAVAVADLLVHLLTRKPPPRLDDEPPKVVASS